MLEKNARPGQKLRLAGSGQCNVTHSASIADFIRHYGGEKKARFVQPALQFFDPVATVRFFESRNVPMLEREDGKIFPKSLKSKDILDCLVQSVTDAGATIRTQTEVISVERVESGFHVRTNRESFLAEKLVLSTGGCSFPQTGSTGDGFRLAAQLGHRIVPPRPALTPVYVQHYAFADCAGIAFRDIKIEMWRNRKIQESRGDVLLTHQGLSGPGILDLSRFIEPHDEIRLELCPAAPNLQPFFSGKKTVKNALSLAVAASGCANMPERFLVRLLTFLEIAPDKPAAEITREERKRLEAALTGLPLTVERLGTWNEAMATSGGVSLGDVNRQTMESRLVSGLFFCGEVLDIDGDTGGYNIQFALSSGFLAGRNAQRLFSKNSS